MNVEDMRVEARRLYDIAVAAADPGPAVDRWLTENWQGDATVILALGKAAPAMMRTALGRMGAGRALVVTNAENDSAVDGAEVLIGEHPVPGIGSAEAGRSLLEAVGGLGADDRVLVLISGGGSALAVAPVAGVSAEAKAEVSRLLLASGLDINAMNLVRQNLSRLKGGGLARAASPAELTALVLSDVIGDDLAAVASGPTVPPAGGPEDAARVLRGNGLWDKLPASVRAALERGDKAEEVIARTVLIGSNRVSLDAMAAEGGTIVSDALVGDVDDAAQDVLACFDRGPGTYLFGGETTVRLHGDGRGGRNQEFALRVALGAPSDRSWVFLSGGTDGRDGPTDAAGGLVDGQSVARMKAQGVDPEALLSNNDSYAALAASGDLLTVGGTGTNVADVQVLILG